MWVQFIGGFPVPKTGMASSHEAHGPALGPAVRVCGGEPQLDLISARGAAPAVLRAVHPGSVVRGQRENPRALGVGSGGREGRWSRVRKRRRAKGGAPLLRALVWGYNSVNTVGAEWAAACYSNVSAMNERGIP